MAKNVFRRPKIRVSRRIKKNQIIEVRVKVAHNSYTGLKIVDGKYVRDKPAYFLKRMEIFYGDDRVCHYDMTSATSPNPLIRFKLKANREAPLKVRFVNNENKVKESRTKVKFA